MSAWLQAMFEAHREPDGVCRPFKFEKRPKKVEVTIQQNTNDSDIMKEHNKLFELVTDLSRENKELVHEKYKLQRELDALRVKMTIAKDVLDSIETLATIEGDKLDKNFKQALQLLINTSRA